MAVVVRPRASYVQEEAELMVDVEFQVVGLAKTHPVALPFLILFTLDGSEGRAVQVLVKSLKKVGIRGSTSLPCPFLVTGFTGEHTSDCEGADGQLVPELHQVLWFVPEEGDDHV